MVLVIDKRPTQGSACYLLPRALAPTDVYLSWHPALTTCFSDSALSAWVYIEQLSKGMARGDFPEEVFPCLSFIQCQSSDLPFRSTSFLHTVTVQPLASVIR